MIKLLMKASLPQGLPPTASKVRAAAGRLSGIVGIVCNALLFVGKFIIGTLSGSVSITADAMNNLSDASSALVTIIGFKLAEKPADEEHPYGHARFEYLSGLAVAAMIVVIGFELAKTSVEKIIHPTAVEASIPMVAVLVGSIGVKLWLSLFNTKLGKHIRSSALLATAADSRNDVISTGAVLLAALMEAVTGWKIDGFMGLGVAVFILYSGCMLAKDTISPL
ncbi:MAG: cation transporter, partial [Oscillospiraceae bacterium]|nr:cation transporter [Oscillospiraceae bacterium]